MLTIRVVTYCLVSLYLVAQFNSVPVMKEYAERSAEIKETLAQSVFEHGTLGTIIESCVEADVSIDSARQSLWSNEGTFLHLYTDVHTITLTDIYATPLFDFEKFEAEIVDYGIRLFVFVYNEKSRQPEYAAMLRDIRSWLIEKEYSKLHQPASERGVAVDIFAVDDRCYQTTF